MARIIVQFQAFKKISRLREIAKVMVVADNILGIIDCFLKSNTMIY